MMIALQLYKLRYSISLTVFFIAIFYAKFTINVQLHD